MKNYQSSKEVIQQPKVGSYYYKKSKNLTDKFYQEIIELENEIQLSPFPSMETVRNLGTLYKKAIETFSGVSNQKLQFYNRKMTQLIVVMDKIKKKKDKKQTRWTKYMGNHKKNTNKFMLFLQIETSEKDANDIMEINEKKFNEGYKHIDSNLNEQEKKFQEMKKKKKRGNYKNIKKEEGISNTDSMNLNNH